MSLVRRFAPLVLLPLLAGCAIPGTNSGIDKGRLESRISADVHLKLLATSDTTVVTRCVKDGSDWKFICLVKATPIPDPSGGDVSATFEATCDSGHGGTCVWRETT